MSSRPSRNTAASVKQRLLNLAMARGEDFNFLLTHYVVERLLYRLSRSAPSAPDAPVIQKSGRDWLRVRYTRGGKVVLRSCLSSSPLT